MQRFLYDSMIDVGDRLDLIASKFIPTFMEIGAFEALLWLQRIDVIVFKVFRPLESRRNMLRRTLIISPPLRHYSLG